MRRTSFFIPTLKEPPAYAQVASHQLMLRAGMIRMLSAGLYTYLPLGLLALRRVESIVREELDRIGGQEFAFSTLIPKELWESSGRWQDMQDDLFSTQTNLETQYVLGPTHEESVTDFAAKHIFSYNQLPVLFYQITTKFRNEKRPRYGLMRTREFLMKDAYSFHESDECLETTYNSVSGAYTKIFTRCDLKHYLVKADSGSMGGSASQEFVVVNPFGESNISFCSHCKVASSVEAANEHFSTPQHVQELPPLELVDTPGKKTIEDVASFLKLSSSQMVKSLVYDVQGIGICMVLVRGDRLVNESKLSKAFEGEKFQVADELVLKNILNIPAGFCGPFLEKTVSIFVDQSVQNMSVGGVVGSNRVDQHYKNFSVQRDVPLYELVDISEVVDGSICGECQQGTLTISKGIELGHIFKLGQKYSQAYDMKITQKSGKKKIPTMGCYGIGVNRLLAALIEQHHDANGIVWPLSVSPFLVNLVTLGEAPAVVNQGRFIYENLQGQGYPILWDDRIESAGFKLADCDLLGMPYQIIVGKKFLEEGLVEVRDRKNRESQYVLMDSVADVSKLLPKKDKKSSSPSSK